MSFQVKPATRVGINPLIVLYSESGCGKTYSSLLLARGMAGKGKIVMADSESGRGSLYADIATIGGYETFDLAAPFSPARYIEAIDTIEASGAAVGVLDSGSHEWEGIGGVLDMAAAIEEKSGKTGLHCWKTPKFEHAKFVQRLLRTRIPLIVCLRAKYKSRQKKDDKGKTVIIKDEVTSPIQAEDFIFEATAHAEILPNHSIIVTKCSHPTLRECFPKDRTDPITVRHGELVAQWCHSAKSPASQPAEKPAESDVARKQLLTTLWTLLKEIRGADKTWTTINQWLWSEEILDPADPEAKLPGLSIERLGEVINKVKAKLAP